VRKLHLVKHSLPVIDPHEQSSKWRLGPAGSRLAVLVAERLAAADVDAVFSSTEPKAEETGRIIADRLGAPFATAAGLQEQARDAVGWLDSPDAFETAVSMLFAEPDKPVFGDETANQAKARFTAALEQVMSAETGDVAVVSHGTVITLYVAGANHLEPVRLWKQLGLPSLVTVEWPSGNLLEVVDHF